MELAVGIMAVVAASVTFLWNPRMPSGYYHDTAGILLNAKCLAATGHDEWGIAWPSTIRSFSDFKPPLYTYVTMLQSLLGGGSLFLMRVVALGMGVVACLGLGLFLRSQGVLRWHPSILTVSLVVAALFTSPWLFVVQRFPVEAVMDPLITLAWLVTAYQLLRSWRWRWAVLHGLVMGIGVYGYHSFKILFFLDVPLLIGATVWVNLVPRCVNAIGMRLWGGIVDLRAGLIQLPPSPPSLAGVVRGLAIVTGVAALVAAPFLHDLFAGPANTMVRFHHVEGGMDNGLILRVFEHLSPSYLFWQGDGNLRHHHGMGGELSIVLVPALALGLFVLIRNLFTFRRPFDVYLLMLIPICALPAGITNDGLPHSLRSHLLLVPLVMMAAHGALSLEFYARRYLSVAVLAFGWIAFGSFMAGRSVWHYHEKYPVLAQSAFTCGPSIGACRSQGEKIPFDQHDPGTVFARLARVSIGRDFRYCREGR